MPIVIGKVGSLYAAELMPPHGGGIRWVTPVPLDRAALIDALRSRGCHQTDIGDAFYEADPDWLTEADGDP